MTTGNKRWIDAIDARLAAGAAAEQLSAATDAPVTVDRAAWAELWPFDGSLGAVTRADVTAVTRSRDWPALLRAVCVWGHGRAGYGPFRVRRLLGDGDVGAKLDTAVTVLRDDGAIGAYQAMLTGAARIAGFGPAFFTKFLAFAHPVVGTGTGRRALVLDRAVARTLVEATAAALAAVSPEGVDPWPAALRLWRDPWPPQRYAVYLAGPRPWRSAPAARPRRWRSALPSWAAGCCARHRRPWHPCGDPNRCPCLAVAEA